MAEHNWHEEEGRALIGRDKKAQRLKQAEDLAETVLDSLSAHIAILDSQGWIVKTNQAWQEFAQANELQLWPEVLQVNYLAICDQAQGESSEHAQEVARGIRAVIAGEMDEFLLDYPCHFGDQKGWFYLRARRMQGYGPLRVVVSHEDITQLKLVQEELESKEAALARQTEELKEANAALKALLRQRDQDKKEIEANVLETVKQEVLPHVRELGSSPFYTRQQVLVRHIETMLQDIVSPFARSLSSHFASLTPQEMRVASLIRQGMSSKEIAQALQCSEYAVLFHRKNLRSKLGLTNKGVNLYSFLQTFSEWEE